MKTFIALIAMLALGCGDVASTTGGGEGGTGAGGGGGSAGGGTCPERECPRGEIFPGKTICDDGNPKTIDRCVEEQPCGGVCENTPAECDGFDLPDVQKVICDDGDPCTDDRCLPATNTCTTGPAAPGTRCEGGRCQNGVCVTR